MDSLTLAHKIVDVILDKQGADTLILDLKGLSTFTDYFVICSAQSRRQLDALSGAIQKALKQEEHRTLPDNVEGTPESGWILLDYGAVVVHLFDEEVRRYYQLEELWDAGRVITRIQ